MPAKKKKNKDQHQPAAAPTQQAAGHGELAARNTAAVGAGSTKDIMATIKPTLISIPKIIHFIWAGGSFLMPEKNRNTVREWAQANPSFECILWIDEKTCGKSKDQLSAEYKDLFGNPKESAEKKIAVVHEDEHEKRDQTIMTHLQQQAAVKKLILDYAYEPVIVLKDIQKAGLRDDLVDYEINQLTPNYGSSSDLLRYAILHKLGGLYIDSDVGHNYAFSLEQSGVFSPCTSHTLYIDHLSQKTEEKLANSAAEYKNFSLSEQKSSIGNDTFISTAQNPLMLKILEEAKKRYKIISPGNKLISNHIRQAHLLDSLVQDITIWKTGPCLINDVFRTELDVQTLEAKEQLRPITNSTLFETKDGVVVKCVRPSKEHALTLPKENFRGWLKVKISHQKAEQAIAAVKKTIEFEANNFNFLRLDYHIRVLAEATDMSLASAFKPVSVIAEELIANKKIYYVALSYQQLLTQIFCQTKNLMHPLRLPLVVFLDVVRIESSYIELERLLEKILLNSDNERAQISINQISPEIHEELCKKIKKGILFLNSLCDIYLKAPDKFNMLADNEFINTINTIMDFYKKYITLSSNYEPTKGLLGKYSLIQPAPSGDAKAQNVTNIFEKINKFLEKVNPKNTMSSDKPTVNPSPH